MPNTNAVAPSVELSAPAMSSRAVCRSVSSSTRGAAMIAAMPTGTLSRNP